MTPRTKSWLKYSALVLFIVALVIAFLISTGQTERWMRSAVISRIEQITGGKVELDSFTFNPWKMHAELRNITVHGYEPAGAPPFFHADYLLLDIRIISLWRRQIALEELRADHPAIHVRFAQDGSSNVPQPKGQVSPSRPAREQLFDLAIRRLRWNEGVLIWNDVRVPLVAEGGAFRLIMDFETPAVGAASYHGQVSWQRMKIALRRSLPFTSDVAAKFTLQRDRFALEELTWKLPASELNASAELPSFARDDWTFRYHLKLAMADVRTIARQPAAPGGQAEFSGSGEYRDHKLSSRGQLAARQISLPYEWFHTSAISAGGSYELKDDRLVVPNLDAHLLEGDLKARVEMDVPRLRFRMTSHSAGMSLSTILAALQHNGFPVQSLHWDAAVAADAVSTWTGGFDHLDSRGSTEWSEPAHLAPGNIPVSAHTAFHVSRDAQAADLTGGLIATPSTRIEMDGRLGMRDSALNVKLDAGDVLPWDDFINALRGPGTVPQRIAGRAQWLGKIAGPLALASFDGHVHAWDAAYEDFLWDEIEGDLSYSHDHLRLSQTRARRAPATALLNLSMTLDQWAFLPENSWNLDVRLAHEDTDGLQSLFHTSFAAKGMLSGTFRGHGTRADPVLSATFTIDDLVTRSMHFDRAGGNLEWKGDEVRVTNGELHKGPAVAHGSLTYLQQSQHIEFELAAADVGLEQLEPLRNSRLPLGGRVQFDVHGNGPLRAPSAEGTIRLTQLKVGDEILGDFDAKIHSDGRELRVETTSTMGTGKLDGHVAVILSGNYPLTGEINVENVDLDPFLQTGLRLKKLTGHSRVVGRFKFAGPLADPGQISLDADVSEMSLDYEYVKLQNVGPLRFTYSRDEIRITSAHLAGPDTDLTFTGFARFAGDRHIAMMVDGRANLRLLTGIWPQLEARGAAVMHASLEGAMPRPRITGRLHLENAAANYGDFPSGLSNVTGDCVFDVNRLFFENVAAEVGGGKLVLTGSVSYGDGPFRFDLNTQAQRVRVRYPVGLSWLTSGHLRLQGTPDGALLSGRVVVERLLMMEGLDLSSVMASRDNVRGSTTGSAFLRNLQFDVEAISSADARLEWNAARFESEAALRVRGTAEHPVLLGHVHLLAGEMDFRGNRYRLTRGDMNFANPFRLDPVIDVEATTTIQQYEVSIQLSGPASHLTLNYHADPPLPPGDIITLLALGHTGAESQLRSTGGGGTADVGARAVLSEAISSQLGGRIERLFGVSRFRVDPAFSGVGADQNATARITIEQRVTRDLTITYVTNVTSTQRQVFQIEYNVSRDLSILALRDENGTFGLDIKRTKRLK